MPRRFAKTAAFLSCAVLVLATSVTWAGGNQNNFRNNAVGGVSIDPTGVVAEPIVAQREQLVKRMRADFRGPAPTFSDPVPLRMISLRGLEAAIREARKRGDGELPDEVKYLAGIQRVKYVFVYPEQKDIVLAGPGEGWRLDEKANVVGLTTGRPVIRLDDLLVAFRSVNQAGRGRGISCSIDPTEEGRRRFSQYISKAGTIRGFNQRLAEQAMGQQRISITGVPGASHLARVMVACDFRMKRYAMNLEEAPVPGLPSFLDLLKARRGSLTNAMPRWWLACDYDHVMRSEDSLAWELRGQGVKVMTEDDFVAADGGVAGTGKTNPIAQSWADLFTEKYDELSAADPVFGELRNIMDLCVVAALIQRHKLLEKAGLELPLISTESSELSIEPWNEPKMVATRCSLMKVGRKYVITASGGVQVESWEVAARQKASDGIKRFYSKAQAADRKTFWWN